VVFEIGEWNGGDPTDPAKTQILPKERSSFVIWEGWRSRGKIDPRPKQKTQHRKKRRAGTHSKENDRIAQIVSPQRSGGGEPQQQVTRKGILKKIRVITGQKASNPDERKRSRKPAPYEETNGLGQDEHNMRIHGAGKPKRREKALGRKLVEQYHTEGVNNRPK